MKDFTIIESDPELFKLVQLKLFDMGYRWWNSGQKVMSYNTVSTDSTTKTMIDGDIHRINKISSLEFLYPNTIFDDLT